MDPKIILMAGLLVVMLVAFGRNPIEDGRPVVKDPFRKSLEDKLSKGNSFTQGETGGQTGIIQNILGDEGGPSTMPGGTPVMQPNQAIGLPGTAYPMQPTLNNGNPNNLPGSYPVQNDPFGGQPDAALQNQVQAARGGTATDLTQEQAPSFYLKDGRRVFFSGFKVFVLGRDGNLRALRDGRYELQSGDAIVIRNGRRTNNK